MEKLNVITDADLINEYGRLAESAPVVSVKTQAPASSDLKLLAGALVAGTLSTDVEVRELNGADEEAIARAGSVGKSLMTILQRGTVSIGGVPATSEILDSLLSGDRDYLLLAIRRVTFGNVIESSVTCPDCLKETPVKVDLLTDVPSKEFDGRWQWDIETKLGVVTVGYYNGITQRKIMDNLDKTTPELNSILLAGCIQAVDGGPVIAADFAKKLGIADREKILMDVIENAPGPRLLEVNKACEACGATLYLPLSLASLFRL